MSLTTPQPPADVLTVLPELAAQQVVTIRLHPRRGQVGDVTASKLGGTFLWPATEPWPECDAIGPPDWWGSDAWPGPGGKHNGLVPVLQLHAHDFPDLPFYPGTNLCQIFWCPLDHSAPLYCTYPVVFWRHTDGVAQHLNEMPAPSFADDSYLPQPCRLHPERIVELPYIEDLTEEQRERLSRWHVPELLTGDQDTPEAVYEASLSVCPSMKLGGYVAWVQRPHMPVCTCGRPMEHFVTMPDMEWDGGNYTRWMPIEEQHVWLGPWQERQAVQSAARLSLGGGALYVFICRMCPAWPIQAVYQR